MVCRHCGVQGQNKGAAVWGKSVPVHRWGEQNVGVHPPGRWGRSSRKPSGTPNNSSCF